MIAAQLLSVLAALGALAAPAAAAPAPPARGAQPARNVRDGGSGGDGTAPGGSDSALLARFSAPKLPPPPLASAPSTPLPTPAAPADDWSGTGTPRPTPAAPLHTLTSDFMLGTARPTPAAPMGEHRPPTAGGSSVVGWLV